MAVVTEGPTSNIWVIAPHSVNLDVTCKLEHERERIRELQNANGTDNFSHRLYLGNSCAYDICCRGCGKWKSLQSSERYVSIRRQLFSSPIARPTNYPENGVTKNPPAETLTQHEIWSLAPGTDDDVIDLFLGNISIKSGSNCTGYKTDNVSKCLVRVLADTATGIHSIRILWSLAFSPYKVCSSLSSWHATKKHTPWLANDGHSLWAHWSGPVSKLALQNELHSSAKSEGLHAIAGLLAAGNLLLDPTLVQAYAQHLQGGCARNSTSAFTESDRAIKYCSVHT